VFVILHVSDMDHYDHLRNEKTSMIASVRREQMERNEEEMRVGKCRDRGRCVECSGPCQVNKPEPQPEHYPEQCDMEEKDVEVQNVDDDDEQS